MHILIGDAILTNGDILLAKQKGSSIIDPDTVLRGSIETTRKLEVIEVLPNFSKPKVIDGKKPAGGEILRFDNAIISANKSLQRERLGKKI